VLYGNGSVVASNAASPFNPSGGIFKLNRVAYADVDRLGNFMADEVRASANGRTGAWIATECNNQSSPVCSSAWVDSTAGLVKCSES
jgi:hypothetical protein